MRKAEIHHGRAAANAVVAITVLLLLAQSFGFSRTYLGVNFLGLEIQLVWLIVAAVIWSLYGELNDALKELAKAQAQIAHFGERIASQIEETIEAIEAKLRAKVSAQP